jgi:hypothetical protein
MQKDENHIYIHDSGNIKHQTALHYSQKPAYGNVRKHFEIKQKESYSAQRE